MTLIEKFSEIGYTVEDNMLIVDSEDVDYIYHFIRDEFRVSQTNFRGNPHQKHSFIVFSDSENKYIVFPPKAYSNGDSDWRYYRNVYITFEKYQDEDSIQR